LNFVPPPPECVRLDNRLNSLPDSLSPVNPWVLYLLFVFTSLPRFYSSTPPPEVWLPTVVCFFEAPAARILPDTLKLLFFFQLSPLRGSVLSRNHAPLAAAALTGSLIHLADQTFFSTLSLRDHHRFSLKRCFFFSFFCR